MKRCLGQFWEEGGLGGKLPGWGCGRGRVWRCCVVYGRCLKGAVVRSISCNAHLIKSV